MRNYIFRLAGDVGYATCLEHEAEGKMMVNLAKAKLTCDFRSAPGEPKCGREIPSAVGEGEIEPTGPAICGVGFARQYGIPID
jgi:hypothetical protein